MSYPQDVKLQQYDEEQQLNGRGGQRVAAWEPISEDKMNGMRERDQTMKKRLRTVRVVVRLLAFILSCFMLYSQVYMLNKYLTTRGIVRDGRNAWATTTTIWPTIVLLVSSAITVLLTGFTLISYAWGVKRANFAAMKIYAPWVIFEIVAHLAVWIGTTVAYRVGKTGSDLWGWSCSSKAGAIQQNFLEVDFSFSCDIQSDAWFVSIAQVVLFIISCIAWFMAWRRHGHQKKIRYRESLLVNSEYQQGIVPPPRG